MLYTPSYQKLEQQYPDLCCECPSNDDDIYNQKPSLGNKSGYTLVKCYICKHLFMCLLYF